ncbi:MAG: DNA invertase [Stutzerimonas stutzeri]|nr:MAG: DNA invertase [Stutzerimonas stutzeri]
MAKGPLPSPSGRLIGYARVSTDDQSTEAQLAELRAAGCASIVQEHASGASRARPELIRLLSNFKAGDTLVVVRLDRLARSVSHLLTIIDELEQCGGSFRSLRDPIDTTTPQGRFSLQVLGAVAELERSLISERTKAGIRAAKAKGRRPGNPGVRSHDPKMLRKLAASRDATYLNALIKEAEPWIPTVRALRPKHTWRQVAAYLQSRGLEWSHARLQRAAGRLAKEGLLDKALLARAPNRKTDNSLPTLVAGIAAADPDLSLRDIGDVLSKMGIRPPRLGDKWQASSVRHMLEKSGIQLANGRHRSDGFNT